MIVAGLALSVAAHAAGGLCKDGTPPPCGGGGGGNKPPVEAGNNLSFPAQLTSGVGLAVAWDVPEGSFGVNYSFGCDTPETIGTTTYPNTSCVTSTGTMMTEAECAAGPCAGLPIERLYWQKVPENFWTAASLGYQPVAPVTVAYLDWGDNLESVSWSESSTIRVETTPFASRLPWAPPFDPLTQTCADAATAAGLDPTLVCQMGFQMWHVYGQGPDEQWGARTTALVEPYVYSSPFAIIHTTTARLHLAKLEPGARTCPGETGAQPPPPDTYTWDTSTATPTWTGTCTLSDIPYTAELNVGGKYVYGYNWSLRRAAMPCTSWLKSGWWRLTFYAPPTLVLFDAANPVVTPLAPPPGVAAYPTVLSPTLTALEEGDTGPLYAPVIDYADNLTYIDICITGKTGGGGGGGGPR
ncbi:MAG: hypothetical protein ACM3OB_00330 [Acidobacteriota bacterium]